MEWRKKWENDWENVRYCSTTCRRQRLSDFDEHLEHTIVALLSKRATDASLCPSEVARAIAPENWRPLMERVREAGRRLSQQDIVRWTQKKATVDPSRAKGPVRFRRGRAFDHLPKESRRKTSSDRY